MNYDNPAHRLLFLLKQGQGFNTSLTCREAWDKIFETNGNLPLLLSRLGKSMELPNHVVEMFGDMYPGQTNLCNHWKGKITFAFAHQNLQANWSNFISSIDSVSIDMLSLVATMIDTKLLSKTFDVEEISKVKTSLQEVYDEVLNSDIADELKAFITRKLREIITSIDEYRLTGLAPILDSVDSSIGHCVTNRAYHSFIKEEALGKKLETVLTSTANSITVLTGLPQLATSIIQLTSS